MAGAAGSAVTSAAGAGAASVTCGADFAAAAAFGKLQEYGDATQQHVEDVQETLQSLLSN